jgi:ribonuclease HIII
MNEGWIGTDEAGKGDYFGPLVIAGVYVNQEYASSLGQLQVRDSKRIADGKVKSLASEIRSLCPSTIVAIGPEKYNELYSQMKNLNRMLAWGHARAIENLLEKVPCPRAVSDQFGHKDRLLTALMKKGREIELEQRTGAEDDIAVAAASILARAEFLNRLDGLSEQWSISLPKGATSVIQAGRAFVRRHGLESLSQVAKVHFKTTQAIMAGP